MELPVEVVASPPIRRVLRPFREFARVEASGGIVLLACTALALAWANSPWAASYDALWHTRVSIAAGGLTLSMDLRHAINDGLMALFFFVVGLEIKREVLVGELADPRRAMLPIAAAAGGMAAPALVYLVATVGTPGAVGWGVPMATDIAFALGVLALLGRRAPLALTVFLTALAIVDDIGAVLVIALFYTADIAWTPLLVGLALILLLQAANRVGVRTPLVYALLGLVVWVAFLESGVHATIAGVLVALTIPAWVRLDVPTFVHRARTSMDHLADAAERGGNVLTDQVQQHALHDLESACERAQAPIQRLEHTLHPWVSFVVMPVFALANAGVALDEGAVAALAHPVGLGVILGLLLGKQVGITLCAWLAVKSGLAALPTGVTWRHVYGAGWLGGIGFTMSLFIAGLAFADEALVATAKVGILAASVVAGAVGYALIATASRAPAPSPVDPGQRPAANRPGHRPTAP
jgi:NhaA family Na+:H+ antiporter